MVYNFGDLQKRRVIALGVVDTLSERFFGGSFLAFGEESDKH